MKSATPSRKARAPTVRQVQRDTALQLPPDVLFHEDLRLLIWKPRGMVNEATVNKILAYLARKEATSRKPFHRFMDMSAQDAVELSFKYVLHVALYRRLTYAGRPPVKSAFYVIKPEVAHLVKKRAERPGKVVTGIGHRKTSQRQLDLGFWWLQILRNVTVETVAFEPLID